MNYLVNFLQKCTNATDDSVLLSVLPDNAAGLVKVAVVDSEGETVTLENDWSVLAEAEGGSVAEALANLETVLAADYL